MANFLSFGNYAGKDYGYDFIKMHKFFENNPNLLPADGAEYEIPAHLGGGKGAFQVADYTIRNEAGQVVGSINWDMPQNIQMVGPAPAPGTPRWPKNAADWSGTRHDIGVSPAEAIIEQERLKGKDADLKVVDQAVADWNTANDNLATDCLAILENPTSSTLERIEAKLILNFLQQGLLNPVIPSEIRALYPEGSVVTGNFYNTELIENADGSVTVNMKTYDADEKLISDSQATTSADGKIITQKLDSNADGIIDSVTTTTTTAEDAQIIQVDSQNDGVIDQTYVIKNGQRYDTTNVSDALQIDALRNNHQLGAISGALMQQMDRAISNTLTSIPVPHLDVEPQGPSGSVTVEPYYGPLSFDPIGAFYEATSAPLDQAASIANQTGVLIGADGQGLSTTAFATLDTNQDGQLSSAEQGSLQIWTDTNENGFLEDGELKTVANAGIHQITSADYGFYTQGNSVIGATPAQVPTAVNLVQAVPDSNYRSLRDNDNHFRINDSVWINFTAAQVKASRANPTYLIGTDNNDNFDENYYANDAQFINKNLFTNFLAGGGDDVMGGSSRNDNLWGGTGNDALLGYAGDDHLYGEEGNDQMQGREGNDYLDGGLDNDTLFGQVGNDTLVGGDGDDLLMGFMATNEAKQTLLADETDNDYLYGGNGKDQLLGGLGKDYLDGGEDNDLLLGSEDTDILFGGAGDDELNGGIDNDQLSGDGGIDKLFGGAGNDTLWGGEGNDTLMGFTPINDSQQTLLEGQTDNDIIFGGAGDDLIFSALGDDQLYGGAGVDEIQAGVGNDMLYGEEGNDHLFGGAGNDTIYGGADDDLIVGGAGSNEVALAAGTEDSNWLYGGAGNDTILGGIGNDYIDGGAGADKMQGGKGDDSYIVNSVNDSILEFANEGVDTVVSSANYILNANIEELRLVEGASINGTGNSLDNRITGNSLDNILDGVTGADTLIGGLGNDTYYVDNIGDQVIENANEGADTVQSKTSYALGDNVENLNLLDFSKAEKGLVDGTAVLVYGYPKANELDYMQGDAVPNYKGTCALTSIANLMTQAKTPTTEAQVLNKAIENNWVVTRDTATDYQRGGSNHAQQQALLTSYGIANTLLAGYNEQGIAKLIQSGRGVMIGLNAGKLWGDTNYLDNGGANHVVTITGAVYGQDKGALMGFYIADSGRSLVSDMTRYVSIADFRIAANVPNSYSIYTNEAIKLWDENTNATGNSLNNSIIGNRGNNTLNGLAGNDSLMGGAGDDTYVFGIGSGTDTIVDADSTIGNKDTISIGAGVSSEQLWFSQSGNDLVMSIIGTGDQDIIKDWYVGSEHQVEQIKIIDGHTLASADVHKLVEVMSSLTPPAMGTTVLSDAQKTTLAPVIAASWA